MRRRDKRRRMKKRDRQLAARQRAAARRAADHGVTLCRMCRLWPAAQPDGELCGSCRAFQAAARECLDVESQGVCPKCGRTDGLNARGLCGGCGWLEVLEAGGPEVDRRPWGEP